MGEVKPNLSCSKKLYMHICVKPKNRRNVECLNKEFEAAKKGNEAGKAWRNIETDGML